MSIYETYLEKVKRVEEGHQQTLAALKDVFKMAQLKCKHEWEIIPDLFYALGNTAPGARCVECHLTRNLTSKEEKKHGKYGTL